MKKCIGLLALTLAIVPLSAIDLTVSLGGDWGCFYQDYLTDSSAGSSITGIASQQFSFGFSLDMRYLTFRTGYTQKRDGTITVSNYTMSDPCIIGSIPLELLGSYPAALGPISIIPMAGIEYDIALSAVNTQGSSYVGTAYADSIDDFNRLYAKAGLAFDIPLCAKLSIRPEAFFFYGLHSNYDDTYVAKLLELMKLSGYTDAAASSRTMRWEAGLFIACIL